MILASSFWLGLLGFDQDQIPENAEVEFSFTHLPQSWGVFVLLAVSLGLFYFVFALYRRESASCPRPVRHGLAVLRSLTLLVLLLIFLGPAVTFTRVRVLQPVVTLLRDQSLSMATEDAYADPAQRSAIASSLDIPLAEFESEPPSRAELLNELVAKDSHQFLDSLEQHGRLRVIDFADQIEEVERIAPTEEAEQVDPTLGLPAVVAQGPGTDLSRAIKEGLSERLASVLILATDGQHNAQSDAEEAALEAKNRNVPLLILGLGDASRPANLQLSDLYADPQVWNKDPFEIQATLRAQGAEGEIATIELIEQTPNPDSPDEAAETILETREVDVPEDNGQLRLSFTHVPETPGTKTFTVRVKPLENEVRTDDNTPPAPLQVKVLDDEAKVLLIAGTPHWEYRALSRLFTREEMVDLSVWLQSLEDGRQQQGNTPLLELPATREELFAYDVVLMLDPDPSEFDAAWIDLLKSFVREHAGGFLYMPGPVHGGPFLTDAQTSSFAEILPVRLGDIGSMEVSSLLSTYNQSWPLSIVSANVDQPIMRFSSDAEETLAIWNRMPGTFWSFPATEAKPAARVLIEHSDPTLRRNEIARPLLVTGQFGAGRTVYLGFDGTWRWRTPGHDAEYFKRFWIQTARYLVEGRSMAGKRRGTLITERSRYEIGERIRVAASLKQSNFEPLEQDEIQALLQIPGEEPQEITFKPKAGTPGEYEAVITASQQGPHTVSLTLPADANSDEIEIDTAFAVTLPIRETQSTWLDKPRLTELASISGGQYFDFEQWDQLPAAIPDRTRKLELPSSPIPIWDTTRILLLLVALLTLEWALRKRFKLL